MCTKQDRHLYKEILYSILIKLASSACTNYICKHFNQVQNASFVVYFS